MSVRLSVTSRHCIKTAKHRITQITSCDGSGTPVYWCQKARRHPLRGAKHKWGRFKLAIFVQHLAISQKRCKINTYLAWNTNRNSYALYWMALFPVTLSDLLSPFVSSYLPAGLPNSAGRIDGSGKFWWRPLEKSAITYLTKPWFIWRQRFDAAAEAVTSDGRCELSSLAETREPVCDAWLTDSHPLLLPAAIRGNSPTTQFLLHIFKIITYVTYSAGIPGAAASIYHLRRRTDRHAHSLRSLCLSSRLTRHARKGGHRCDGGCSGKASDRGVGTEAAVGYSSHERRGSKTCKWRHWRRRFSVTIE